MSMKRGFILYLLVIFGLIVLVLFDEILYAQKYKQTEELNRKITNEINFIRKEVIAFMNGDIQTIPKDAVFSQYGKTLLSKVEKLQNTDEANRKETIEFLLNEYNKNLYKFMNKLIQHQQSIMYEIVVIEIILTSILFIVFCLWVYLFYERIYRGVKRVQDEMKKAREDIDMFSPINYPYNNRLRDLIEDLNDVLEKMKEIKKQYMSQKIEKEQIEKELDLTNKQLELSMEELKETTGEIISIRKKIEEINKERKKERENLLYQLEKEKSDAKKQKKYLRIVSNIINDTGVLLINKEGTIDYANKFMYNFAQTKDIIIGKDIKKIFGKLIDWDDLLEETQNKGELKKNIYLQSQMNEKMPFLLSASVVYDDKANITGYVVVFESLLNKKYIKEEIQELHKMESVGLLLSGIVHDLNNLLSVIVVAVELIKRKEKILNSEYVNKIELATGRAINMLKSLLSFVKKKTMVKHKEDINNIIRNMSLLIKESIDTAIKVKLELDENIEPVCLNKEKIEQVILNLVINAGEAIDPPGEITIKTKKIENKIENKKYVLLEISDTGKGIPEKIRDKIFTPFFTTKEKGKGAGLGLSIVYSIIMEHNGQIDFDTSEKGTTFYIKLPLSSPNEKEGTDVLLQDSDKLEDVKLGGNKETVLIVDDEDILRDMLAEIFTYYNYNVYKAESGETALSIVDEYADNIDVIVLDIKMKGMTGVEFLRRIREKGIDIPVVVSTGFTGEKEKKMLYDLGISGFLSKPYKSEEILRKIKKILK